MSWQPTALDASLSYWSAPHPGWKPEKGGPDGWPQEVRSAAVDVAGAPLVLIDPLAPVAPEDAAFWTWLSARRSARAGLAILLSNRYHGRSAADILTRFPETPVYSAASTDGHATVPVTHAVSDGASAPAGIVAVAIDGLDDGELAWHIPSSRTLYSADALLGTPTGVRLAPRSWCKDSSTYDPLFLPSIRRLTSLPIDHLLVSHGPFSPGDGVAKLTFAAKSAESRAT